MADSTYQEILTAEKGNALLKSLIPNNTIYLGFSTTTPVISSGSNFTEPPASTGYERVLLDTITTPSGKQCYNSKEIHFNEAQTDYSGVITHWGLFSSNAPSVKPFATGEIYNVKDGTNSLEVKANTITILRQYAFMFAIDKVEFDAVG